MNTILQQRIEEAAEQYAERRFNTRLLYDMYGRQSKSDFLNGAIFALQNQWISVEEALPNVSEYNSYQGLSEHVFAMNEESEDAIVAWYDNKSKNWYQEWNGGERVPFEITHWMSIPEMKGGE